MSEKVRHPADRRRRTTRGGRRRSLRPQAPSEPPASADGEAHSIDSDPEDAIETGEWGEASRAAVASAKASGADGARASEAASDFEDFAATPTQPPPVEPEIEVAADSVPAPAATGARAPGTLDDEKTNPRNAVGEALRAAGRAALRPKEPEIEERTNPKIDLAELKVPAPPSVVVTSPVVVIAQARIISDYPRPAAPSEERTAAPASSTAPGVPAPVPAPSESTPSAQPPAASAAPQASAGQPPAALARDPKEDSGLQLVEVEVAEMEDRASPAPPTPVPPPPPEVRAKSAAPAAPPKRPPPPPGPPAAKPEDERQKRKQVRQWWERFFSEDYLLTVLPPSRTQISRQADFMVSSLGLASGATVLDVGCGLGLHAIELTRRGYLVVGLDLSLAMITRAAEAAQEQGLKVNFVHADIREMEFDGAFDAVACMGTTFGFFDEEANRDVLTRLHHALRPGGRLLLDVANRDHLLGSQPNLVWFEGDGCVCMEESDFNFFNSRLTVKRTMMRDDGRQSQAEYSVRVYSLHELGQLLHQSGFRVIEVSGQEAVRGAFFGANAPRIVLMAERRAAGARPSVVMSPERGSGEGMRGSTFGLPPERASADSPRSPVPAERASAEVPKPPPKRD